MEMQFESELKRSKGLIIAGIAVAMVISSAAIITHFRLSALERRAHRNESAEDIAREILTGQPAHREGNETPGNATAREAQETPEERAAEGK